MDKGAVEGTSLSSDTPRLMVGTRVSCPGRSCASYLEHMQNMIRTGPMVFNGRVTQYHTTALLLRLVGH